jgi:DNA-binding MarR family transcriptional regulator
MAVQTKTKADLAAELGRTLMRVGRHSKRSLRPELERVGLTLPQAITLHSLAAAGGRRSARDIGRECDMLASTATGVIDRLEQHGYVRRERDGDDRRVVWVELTDAGRRVQSAIPAMGEHMGRAFTALSLRELEQMLEWVQRVEDAVEQDGGR